MPERLLNEQRVKDHINHFYVIKDPLIRKEYEKFNNHCQSTEMLLILNFLLSFIVFPYLLARRSLSDLEVGLLATAGISGWLLSFITFLTKAKESVDSEQQQQFSTGNSAWRQEVLFRWLEEYYPIIQTIFLFTVTCLTSGYSLRETWWKISNGTTTTTTTTTCTSDNCFLVFAESIYLAMLLPLLVISITREYRLFVIVPTVVIPIASGIALALILQSISFALMTIGYFLFACLLTADRMKQQVLLFFMKRKLQETLAEKERMEAANRAEEMRCMVANVAHDLKTPLSSFMAGIETIRGDVEELEMFVHNNLIGKLSSTSTDRDDEGDVFAENKLSLVLSSLKASVRNIQNTNSFMLMTINRCLDYTKAQSGLKLVPKYDTIDFKETLHLPMDCMMNIQQKVEIVVEKIDEKICSHIITDGQWLQENLLCLLSNAVKYSDCGKVGISVLLVEHEAIHGAYKLVEQTEINCIIRKSFSSSQLSSHLVLIEIQDNGIGLSEEEMKALFHPFKQSQRLAGGTGLGLYSLARRLEALKGKYGVKKRPDGSHGSLFWFAFPYRPDEVTAAALMKPDLKPDSIEPDLKTNSVDASTDNEHSAIHSFGLPLSPSDSQFTQQKSVQELPILIPEIISSPKLSNHYNIEPLRLLLCDDSPSLSKMISRLLEKQGHSVTIAENGFIGWNIVKDTITDYPGGGGGGASGLFDIILMDLQMPVMDGLEATRRIREFERNVQDSIETNQKKGNSNETTTTAAAVAVASSPFPSFQRTNSNKFKQLIIGMSANSDHETMQEAFQAGVDSFIAKPFTAEEFMKMVIKLKSKT